MDRTLIAWNVPNLITIPLMAFVGFLVFAVIVQIAGAGIGHNSRAMGVASTGY
jgi:hypothetical protein